MRSYYLILCRSLTYAQRTAFALERMGIPAPVRRAPTALAEEGCGYGVQVREGRLCRALAILARAGLTPRRVFLAQEDGEYREVVF